MIRNIALAALAATAIAATPASAATDYVQNGGFDTVSNNSQNFQVDPGNPYGSVSNWSTSSTPSGNPYNILFHSGIATSGNAVGEYSYTGKEYLNALPANNAGHGNFMALDGDTNVNGNFFQTLTGLVTGNTYTLTFDWATGQIASRSGATSEGLTVQIGNLTATFGPTATPSGGATPWTTVTRTFQASGTTQVLNFLAVGSPNGLPPVALLDNVSVKQAVPEPSTWAMMLVGFGMVGASLRYRRRTTLAAAV